jgi:phospholipase/carboxylesterase
MSAGITRGEVDLRIREAAGDPAGALILNHGRAADENDLYPLLDELDPERRLLGVTTGAPLRGLPPGGRHWYVVERVGFPHAETFQDSYAQLAARLDELLRERELSWSSTAIGGFSQGTVMAYAVALGAGRPTPAAVLAMSGFLPVVEGWQPQLEDRQGLRVLIRHGVDDPVIPVQFARRARETLEGALEVDYAESDGGHWLPPEVLPAIKGLLQPLGTGA